jgi:4-hydroxy-tetrahydrodipicolinate reductase
MGSEVIRSVLAEPGLDLVGAVDPRGSGGDAGLACGLPECGIIIQAALADALADVKPDVVVDFTEPSAALGNALTVIHAGARPVVGTTGITASGLQQLRDAIDARGTAGLVAPNFAIGAVLLMKFAEGAARYLPHCEIIEMHHDNKKDAPSGTALYTAELISRARGPEPASLVQEQILVEGARGGRSHGIPVHSIRLPGFVASQEVIFGGPGQTLSIRHDTTDRKCFMPGVMLASRVIVQKTGFFLGLESILDL